MLFVYDPPHVATFEIKSVPFPLDVVFVGAGTRVTRVVPLDATHPTAASPSSVGYVLELPGGWCERHGVAVGTRMSLSAR